MVSVFKRLKTKQNKNLLRPLVKRLVLALKVEKLGQCLNSGLNFFLIVLPFLCQTSRLYYP